MRKLALLLLILGLAIPVPRAAAQDKSNDGAAGATPLKIQIVFTEADGDKKVKSMPYTMVFANATVRGPDVAKLRVGSRVPLYTGKDSGLQYIDVGTNLDCRAEKLDEGRYSLRLSLERSWVQADVQIPVEQSAPVGGSPGQFKEPVIGQYKIDAVMIARVGQPVDTTTATDPITGRTLKIDVTLTVLK
ncbi:MAG TPA: hypothetical protein VN933_01585 [Candidatus Eremiobacteraceae bacterium]|jgi:hypothetical protein|nr:hypothetical protein [Candidatus Eremiobacteraceae bacterium]